MSEFKGTKGKWKIKDIKSPFETTINSSEYRIAEVKHFGGKNFNDPIEKEAKANALLISKAPEMLEMLKYFTAFPDEDFEEDMDKHISFPMTVDARKIKEAKQLIKEVTEL